MERLVYDVVASNVGYVLTNESSYEVAKSVYNEYIDMGYDQVSLWASNELDPIEIYEVPGYEELIDAERAKEQEGE